MGIFLQFLLTLIPIGIIAAPSTRTKLYHFSESTLSCPGLNPFTHGLHAECTDFASVNLRSSRTRNYFGRPDLVLIGSSFSTYPQPKKLAKVHFTHADARYLNARNCLWENITLEQTDLRGADLRGLKASGLRFIGNNKLTGVLVNEDTELSFADQSAAFDDDFLFTHYMIYDSSTPIISYRTPSASPRSINSSTIPPSPRVSGPPRAAYPSIASFSALPTSPTSYSMTYSPSHSGSSSSAAVSPRMTRTIRGVTLIGCRRAAALGLTYFHFAAPGENRAIYHFSVDDSLLAEQYAQFLVPELSPLLELIVEDGKLIEVASIPGRFGPSPTPLRRTPSDPQLPIHPPQPEAHPTPSTTRVDQLSPVQRLSRSLRKQLRRNSG